MEENVPLRIITFSPNRFNRICLLIAALWLLLTVPLGKYFRPTDSDFQQFYMGGLMVRLRAINCLYPVPHWDSVSNPGMVGDSELQPGDAALRLYYNVPDVTRYILPPPSALLFVPLSYLPYPVAERVYVMILAGCVWGVAWYAGRMYTTIRGGATAGAGLLSLFVAVSPMTARAIRIENTTPIIALLIAYAAHELLRRDSYRAGLALVFAFFLKYIGGVLVPLMLVMRRWRSVGWMVLLGLGWTLLALVVMGTAPFITFSRTIAPLLGRPERFIGNQSLPAMIHRMIDPSALMPTAWQRGLLVAQFIGLAVVLAMIARMRHAKFQKPVMLCAACTSLLAWMMIFSPVCWEHYPIFLAPFWGWLIWEAQQSFSRRWIVGFTLFLMNVPLSIVHVAGFIRHDWSLPEPQNSSQLWSLVIVWCMSLDRLGRGIPTKPLEPDPSTVKHHDAIEKRDVQLAPI